MEKRMEMKWKLLDFRKLGYHFGGSIKQGL